MKYEVETKVKVYDLEKLRTEIKKIARFYGVILKTDNYYAIQKRGYPKKAFRIRNSNGIYIVNFKKWIKSKWDSKVVVKEEYEFKVENIKEFLELMKDLGFFKWITKIKHAEQYRYHKNKNILIELCQVKGLGNYMEIEYLANKNEIDKAKKIIKDILKELKISEKEIENVGYTKLLWKKHN